MSLTQSAMVFLDVLEDAANVILRAFFTGRPRYLSLTSLAPTSPNTTHLPPIPPFNLDWSVDFPMPQIDFHAPNAAWPSGQLVFAIDEFGIWTDPAKFFVSGFGSYAVVIKITGKVALLPISTGYALEFSLVDAEVVNTNPPGPNSVPAFLLSGLTFVLKGFLQPFSPLTLPLPPLSIGPIVPAIAPIIDNHEFVLRGSL